MPARSKVWTGGGPWPFGVRARPRPARRRWGIIASADRGMQGGRRELGTRPPPAPSSVHPPRQRRQPRHCNPHPLDARGGEAGAPRVRGWGEGTATAARPSGQVAHSARASPSPAPARLVRCCLDCRHQRHLFTAPRYVLDPVPGWSNSPAPDLRKPP